jgi:hypothetical protein
LLNVLLKASQQALGSLLKENLGTIATALPRRVEETEAAVQGRMAGATETRQQRVDKSKEDLQEHVTEGLTSAAKDGAQET